MDAELFAESIEYERLTQSVYQAILRREGQNIEVLHNQDVEGKSGVAHQVDVLWRFTVAGVNHMVLIECKNYASALTLEKVRNFFAILHDIGNCSGVMVTRTGYQSGVKQFAKFYGIGLKLLRQPIPDDWDGKIKDIQLNLTFNGVVSRDDRLVKVRVKFAAKDAQEEKLLKELQVKGRLSIPSPPDLVFWSNDKKVITNELRWWLPSKLAVAGKAVGGPYKQAIPLEEHYLLFNVGEADEILAKVAELEAEYYVEEVDNSEILIRGEELVEAILKDFQSGEVEYVKHKGK
ncbi:MAG: restriction endonuclease [Rubinisphaera brasiliensis]|uniref:restriction endonuclease n=1 Tax=Rubinisphaera brasiliensis TaxID=119 RepID=UPI00391B32E5